MRLPNLVRASVGVLLLVVLSGCTPSDAIAPPEPTATFVAPYATDEEALAAAEAAYAEYTRISGEILRDGGKDAERIFEIAVGDFAQENFDGMENLEERGGYSTGVATFDQVELQRYSATGGDREIITIYVCHDVSAVDVLDSAGVSVVPDDRLDRSRMEATFDFDRLSNSLKISSRENWPDPEC